MHIGLLEDEAHWADLVAGTLADAGWRVTRFDQASQACESALADGFDALVVDVHLRDQSLTGMDVVRRLRNQGCGTPVLVLTQFAGMHQAADTLNDGADDYLAKPFDAAELIARLRAITRRLPGYDRSELVSGALRISLHYGTVHWFDRRLELSSMGFDILRALAETPGDVVSYATLWARVWSKWNSLPPQMDAIQAGISRLRRDIAAVTSARLIQTVQGRGYRLVVD
ncbi:response regulator transcription factor [Sphingomonas sp. CJ99]